MKLINSKTYVLLSLIITGLLISCENEQLSESNLTSSSFSKEIQENLTLAGFDINETHLVKSKLPNGEEQAYYSYHDMLIKTSDILSIKNMIATEDATNTKAFTTHFTVNGNRVYKVAFVDFFAPRHKQGCQDLIYKFNEDLKTTIKLEPIFVSSSEINNVERDITVWWTDLVDFNGSKTAFFGRAEFPDAYGNPGRNVQMNFHFYEQFSRGFLRTLLLHEFGHVFGLRHSDYQTRRSCGGNNPEIDTIGEEYIPTTDNSGDYTESIMRACFFEGEELGYYPEDITAMRWIYGHKPN